MKITRLQSFILKRIAGSIVKQSQYHRSNIIEYYRIINDAAKNEFNNDNEPTLSSFLSECFDNSKALK